MLAGCCMHFKDVSGYLLHLEMYVSFGSIYKSHIFFPFQIKWQCGYVPFSRRFVEGMMHFCA